MILANSGGRGSSDRRRRAVLYTQSLVTGRGLCMPGFYGISRGLFWGGDVCPPCSRLKSTAPQQCRTRKWGRRPSFLAPNKPHTMITHHFPYLLHLCAHFPSFKYYFVFRIALVLASCVAELLIKVKNAVCRGKNNENVTLRNCTTILASRVLPYLAVFVIGASSSATIPSCWTNFARVRSS